MLTQTTATNTGLAILQGLVFIYFGLFLIQKSVYICEGL
jgi:hypothetical protein